MSSLRFESLEERKLFAVTASFLAGQGVLTVFGDALDNTITLGNLCIKGRFGWRFVQPEERIEDGAGR